MSSRRVTRSQTSNSSKIPMSKLIEESEKNLTKSRQRNQQQQQQQDRTALIDITNDSPIVGLAARGLGAETTTPASSMAKQKSNMAKLATPGSGEALLRGQVKTLLQKVEEEAVFSKLGGGGPFLHLKGLLAPTPANTPCTANPVAGDLCANNCGVGSALVVPVASGLIEEKLNIPQVMIGEVVDGNKQEEAVLESQRSLINRSLLLDFSEKSEIFDLSDCSSVVTDQEMGADEDNASAWSTQVNASVRDDEEEVELSEVGVEQEQEDYYEDDEEGEEDSGLMIDELCEGMKRMNMVKFTGKHTRFVYNSDDEFIGGEVCADDKSEEEPVTGEASPGMMRLRDWSAPEGKHLRFPDEDELEEK